MRYLALILAALTTAEMQAYQLAPKLVVNITIDQLRADYMEAFNSLYSANGFRRILQNGLVYDNANYPFSTIDAASATATISTGTTPFYNGVVANQWLDRKTLQPVLCVEGGQGGYSPQRLKTSTVGDELKLNSKGKAVVYSFSIDKERAILSAGHAADGAFWIDTEGKWRTSTFYCPSLPKWLTTYNNTPGIQAKRKRKRFTNDDVVEAVIEAVNSSELGRDDISDLLCVNLSATSAEGRSAGNWQTEMETVYLQLDNTLAKLINGITSHVSFNSVLFVLTSTGYSEEELPDYERFRIPTGTFYVNRTASLLNMYLGAIYGQGRYVEQCFNNELYLNHKLIEQKRVALTEILSRCQEFLVQNAGVADVYTSDRLISGNDNVQKLRNGFNPTLNGDIIVEVAPGWKLLNEDTHQTFVSRAATVNFPIIFFGFGITPGHVSTPVTVERIAPTVSKSLRIRAPNACTAEPLF